MSERGSCEFVTHSPHHLFTHVGLSDSVYPDLAGVSRPSGVRLASNHCVGILQMRSEIGHCKSLYATRHFLLREREGPSIAWEGGSE